MKYLKNKFKYFIDWSGSIFWIEVVDKDQIKIKETITLSERISFKCLDLTNITQLLDKIIYRKYHFNASGEKNHIE